MRGRTPSTRPGTTTMNQEQAFIEAIAAEPEQDAHRLVFADWLDDQDEPDRAEFIRVQCELARLGPDDERRPDLARREAQLRSAHGAAWLGPLSRFFGSWQYRRGLLEVLEIDARA